MPSPPRIRKALVLVPLAIGLFCLDAAGTLLLPLALRASLDRDLTSIMAAVSFFLVIIGFGFLLWGILAGLRAFYLMWSIIPGRIPPARAVGRLFIPVFHFYWIFPSHVCWAQDYNNFVRHHGIPAPPVSERLCLSLPLAWTFAVVLTTVGLTFGILTDHDMDFILPALLALMFVPLVWLAYEILVMLFLNQGCNAINAIPPHLRQDWQPLR